MTTGGSNPRRLKRVYADEADDRHAAEAEATRLRRAAASLSVTLALGRPAPHTVNAHHRHWIQGYDREHAMDDRQRRTHDGQPRPEIAGRNGSGSLISAMCGKVMR